ncbi:MAG TPA: LamG domain-containing protein [Segetibacter sp.]|jgi:hypothetical protein
MKSYLKVVLASLTFLSCKKEDAKPIEKPDTIKNGLIAYYPFTGNTKDSSGNNYDLTENTATLAKDKAGNSNTAYYFDGVNSSMTIPSMPKANLLDSFTISFWMRPATHSVVSPRLMAFQPYADQPSGIPVTYSHSIELYNPPSTTTYRVQAVLGTCTFTQFNNSCSGTGVNDAITNTLNTWKHVAFGKRGRALYLYVDGKKFTNLADKDILASFGFGGRIGNGRFNDRSWFKGELDEIRIHNRLLSEEEVQQLYTRVQ